MAVFDQRPGGAHVSRQPASRRPDAGGKVPLDGGRLVLDRVLHPALGPAARAGAHHAGGFSIGDKRQFFALGGYAYEDVLRSVLLMQRQFAFLRGYPVNVVVGDSFMVASAEYRAPLLWIERGYQTFPLYLRRIWGAAFVDAGNAYQGPFHLYRAEDRRRRRGPPRVRLFYYIDSQIQLGYARGFQSGGGNQLYFVAAASF